MHTPLFDPLRNQLLAALPQVDFTSMAANISTVAMSTGQILNEVDDIVRQVYFPLKGMVSLLSVLRDGRAVETATIGREGIVNAMAGLGLLTSNVRVVVQIPLNVAFLPISHFRDAVSRSASIRNMCITYNEVLLNQARVSAVCNTLHSIEQRFCRWLLQSSDRAESNTFYLTHELLAEMLGVQRTSVTRVAQKVHKTGAIGYSHGLVEILDRPLLLRLSCECYQTLLDEAATSVS